MIVSMRDRLHNPNTQLLLIEGVLFFSLEEAAAALDCAVSDVVDRLDSTQCPTYQRLSIHEASSYLQTLTLLKTVEL